MNSEITNVVKLSPVTVVKADKQANEKSFTDLKTEIASATSASNDSPVSKANQKQEDDKKTDSKPSLEAVQQAANEGNNLLQSVKRNLEFKVDDASKELVVKIVDSESGELVRQIPSEEMLAFIKKMKELDGHQGSMLQDRA